MIILSSSSITMYLLSIISKTQALDEWITLMIMPCIYIIYRSFRQINHVYNILIDTYFKISNSTSKALNNIHIFNDHRPLRIEDFHIGFKYQEYEMDKSRYLNRGMIWVDKTYHLTSPRLHKISKSIEEKKIRRPLKPLK